jgi:uncharacterized secreted protein with C-terminal beta-propeller domain
MRSRSAAGAGIVAVLVLAAGAVSLLPGAAPTASAEALMPYDSCDALLEQYRDALEDSATPWGWGMGGGRAFAEGAAVASGTAGGDTATTSSGAAGLDSATGSGPTGTNLQEQGVDEPDVAKTSGDLLLAVAHNRLQVLRAGATPTLLSSTPLGREAWGGELLVDGDRVLVILPQGGGFRAQAVSSSMPYGGSGTVRLVLLDIAEPERPRVLEELQLDGRYLSARLSDGAVRLVTSSTPSPEPAYPAAPHGGDQERAALEKNRETAREVTLDQVLPRREHRTGGGDVLADGPAVECEEVRHPPSPRGTSTLLVSTFDLDQGLGAADSTGVTTDGDLVYASSDRLYVATSRWGTTAPPADDRPSDTATSDVENEVTTELHAFDTTAADRTPYVGSGSVPGYLMGRWALSSHEGHLRVATTTSPPWNGDVPSSSSVIVLEEQPDRLQQVGRVDGLGIDERIFAVRYFGDLATVVTFRQTDPLYVVDLADPTAPKVLGELKIPGFSTYLHPVGDDLLLGVGQDADEQGRVTGMQVSLFDLSDRTKPVQVDRLSLGQGWTDSAHDSRAFGYDTSRRTALLPFSTWDGQRNEMAALGIRVTDERTLVEAGRMQVLPDYPISRVLHDGERLYAVTPRGVAAGDLDDFSRLGAVEFGS